MTKLKPFLPWIILFTVALASIPVILHHKGFGSAKILGIVVVILVVAALWVWRINTRKKSPRNAKINLTVNDKHWMNRYISFYKRLDNKDKVIFENRIAIFIADVTITEIGKDKPEKETCLYVAASAIIAFWGLPYYNYGNLQEVLVYPSNFDDDNSLNKHGVISGKVHHGGLMNNTMILSLPALVKGFQIDNDKQNVGIHEFAHLLDKSDGQIDGVPEYLGEEDKKIWVQLMKETMRKINDGDSTIPDYGGISEAEFFAVITTYYKECPQLLKIKNRPLFDFLENYFNATKS
ncbi:M90 family metallopeptidase [Brumimicrobium aurantiacum]|uniref:Peptidase n=1 Tax=Brumimicrobium aurantiacum TaxID=1737063 RepID=A0A3E1F026_9FLAO|nr:M90 family metallopeptidase [Brumimicrobium aurantiacum]RFC55179.1 peptidase [Brumimicrobium aurantiacum]